MSGYHDSYGGDDGGGYGDPYGIQSQHQQQHSMNEDIVGYSNSMYSTAAEEYGHHSYYHPSGGGVGGGIHSDDEDEDDSDYNHGVGGDDDDDDDIDDNNIIIQDDDIIVDGEEDDDDSEGIDFDDPSIADLPRILLMGPRRGGKTSIQRVVFHKMSPHETLFRLEATQNLERAVVDHTPLCRFTIWDFPGDYYGPMNTNNTNMMNHNHPNDHHHHGAYDDYYTNTTSSENNITTSSMGIPIMQRQPIVHGDNHQQQFTTNNATQSNTTTMNNNNTNNNMSNTNNSNNSKDSDNNNIDDGDAYIFGRATALIFVIDAQDEPYDHVLQNLTETVARAIRANPHIAIEVFINKVDGELFLSDDAKYDCRRDVMQQVSDELADRMMDDNDNNTNIPTISYHLTSIYDHSVFEAFSRVVQKLIPQLPTLENLLNVLVSTCSMEKAYLFDVASKLYISTDSSLVDMQSVELCSDMIDVVLDVSGIYGHNTMTNTSTNDDNHDNNNNEQECADTLQSSNHKEQPLLRNHTEDAQINHNNINSENNNMNINGELTDQVVQSKIDTAGSHHHHHHDSDIPIHITQNDDNNNINTAGAGGLEYSGGIVMVDPKDELVGTLISQGAGGEIEENEIDEKNKDDEIDPDSAYDHQSSSIIRLSNGMVLYLKEVDTMLALVCLTRSENFVKKSLINYNIGCLKKALRALVKPTTSSDTLTATTATSTPNNNNNNNGRTW